MQGQHHESAVSSEAVESGVTNSQQYETLSQRMHGFGDATHLCNGVERSGSASLCGRCSKSTAGENFEKPLRASTVYDGEDARTPDQRIEPESNDPAIAAGTPDQALAAVAEQAHDPDSCTIEKCARCNHIDEGTMQPEYTVQKGGGSKSGRKKKKKGGGGFDHSEPPMMVSYETEEARAKRLARENEQRIEISDSRPGPKIKGKEKRMHVQGTMEPTKVAELNEMTGQTCIQILEQVHGILAMAKSGAEGTAVLEAVIGLLKAPEEPRAA